MLWPQARKSGLQLAVGSGDGAGNLITVSGRLIILGYSRTEICCACIFLSSILSSFVFSLSSRARLDLTTILSTGPLTRL